MLDSDIIALYFARDERAIRETDTRYGRLCQTLAMRLLSDRQDAEECVNDTWLETWNSIPPHRPDSLQAYVCRIVRCLSFNRWQKKHAKKRDGGDLIPLEELAECLPDGDTLPGADDLSRGLSDFVQSLDDTACGLFVGHYWYNYPIDRLARAYGLTKGAVKMRLSRLRSHLRAFLAERGYVV